MTPITKLVLIDHSTSPVSPDDMNAMLHAIAGQLLEFSNAWGLLAPISFTVAAYNTPNSSVPDDTAVMGIWDDADQPGAAGYHAADPRGKPFGKVFRNTCDCVRNARKGGTFSLSSVLSHEALELWGDKPASIFAMRADGATIDALEACDACQEISYPDPKEPNADLACTLSDYLLPAAFDASAQGPYDRQGALRNQYDTTPGGYRITATASANPDGTSSMRTYAVYGEKHPMNLIGSFEGMPMHLIEAKRAARLFPGSRPSMRGVMEWISEKNFRGLGSVAPTGNAAAPVASRGGSGSATAQAARTPARLPVKGARYTQARPPVVPVPKGAQIQAPARQAPPVRVPPAKPAAQQRTAPAVIPHRPPPAGQPRSAEIKVPEGMVRLPNGSIGPDLKKPKRAVIPQSQQHARMGNPPTTPATVKIPDGMMRLPNGSIGPMQPPKPPIATPWSVGRAPTPPAGPAPKADAPKASRGDSETATPPDDFGFITIDPPRTSP